MELLNLLYRAIQYGFIQRALVCGVLIAVASSLLGNFLVLRKQSLISDGLSHVSFATIALSLLLGLSPLLISIPLVIFASILINKLSERANMYSDSAIGLVSAIGISSGVVIISMSKGFNIDIYSYLFGSILAISQVEVIISLVVSIIVIIIIVLFFNDLFLLTYDEDYAHISGVNIKLINLILAVVQSIIIVIGIKIVGAMLMSSLIIFPAISSLQVALNFKKMIIISICISVFSVIGGIILSFLLNSPTGATIVLLNGVIFLCFFLLNKIMPVK